MRGVTDGEPVDAVAIGQVTPGPVFTTATFLVTRCVARLALWSATVGISLPAFVLVAASGPLIRSAAVGDGGSVPGRRNVAVTGPDGRG